MAAHALPAPSQRSHARANVIGADPVQPPSVPVSVWPSAAMPETNGGSLLTGGAWAIGPTATESALAEPAAFDAVTCTTSLWPASADCAVYAAPVAPPIAAQFAPAPSHRRHS